MRTVSSFGEADRSLKACRDVFFDFKDGQLDSEPALNKALKVLNRHAFTPFHELQTGTLAHFAGQIAVAREHYAAAAELVEKQELAAHVYTTSGIEQYGDSVRFRALHYLCDTYEGLKREDEFDDLLERGSQDGTDSGTVFEALVARLLDSGDLTCRRAFDNENPRNSLKIDLVASSQSGVRIPLQVTLQTREQIDAPAFEAAGIVVVTGEEIGIRSTKKMAGRVSASRGSDFVEHLREQAGAALARGAVRCRQGKISHPRIKL